MDKEVKKCGGGQMEWFWIGAVGGGGRGEGFCGRWGWWQQILDVLQEDKKRKIALRTLKHLSMQNQ